VPLLTQDEVAAILRCHPSTVARLRYAGELSYIPMRPVKIRSEDVERWMAKNRLRAQEGRRAAPTPDPAEKARADAEGNARMVVLRYRLMRMRRE
jgi:excisionase family DNA binding protein